MLSFWGSFPGLIAMGSGRHILQALMLFTFLGAAVVAEDTATDQELKASRSELDLTVWSQEVAAQAYEQTIVKMWDALRGANDQLKTLSQVPLTSLTMGRAQPAESLDQGVQRIEFSPPQQTLDRADWLALIKEWDARGFRLVESEWHHSNFSRDEGRAVSTIDFVLHVVRDANQSSDPIRVVLRGKMRIEWTGSKETPVPGKVVVDKLDVLARRGQPAFQKVFMYGRRQNDVASAHPIILHDLDRNGFPEIIISRWNRLYRNFGGGKFQEEILCAHPIPLAECALVADVTDNGAADLVSVDKLGRVVVFEGNSEGKFEKPHRIVCQEKMPGALAMTCGDIDLDGDIDLFVSQYKPAYLYGQMPTPYYDANDGEPAFLLRNEGEANFVDATREAGISKRNRRTYSASFFDVDSDRDLDLLVVSDYAGVDLYRNDGTGKFSEATRQLIDEPHLFGMAHTLGDYDLDGRSDIYAIGMSSTTARRLDAMQLGREDREDVQRMRSRMGYGNRMYLRRDGKYVSPSFSNQVARTGWSWGTTSFDFDLDGDEDIYVANGFRSGQSCADYCSTFWRHDIYTGSSEHDPNVASLFLESMKSLNEGKISWNGFEHNALLHNLKGRDFVNSAFLHDVACEFDARSVVGGDLDGDGRPDLIVAEYEFVGRGFVTTYHIYRNALEHDHHWIGVRLYESSPEIGGLQGATVTLESKAGRQVRQLISGDSFLSQHDDAVHFGLGENDSVEKITVELPNGKQAVLKSPEIDRYHTVHFGNTPSK